MFTIIAATVILQVRQDPSRAIDIASVLQGAHWMTTKDEDIEKLQAAFLRLAKVDPEVLFPYVVDYLEFRREPSGEPDPAESKIERFYRQVDVAVLAFGLVSPIFDLDPIHATNSDLVFDYVPWTSASSTMKLLPCPKVRRELNVEGFDGLVLFRHATGASRLVKSGKVPKDFYYGGFDKQLEGRP